MSKSNPGAEFIDVLHQEIAALEASLEGDVRYVRLTALRAVLEEYAPKDALSYVSKATNRRASNRVSAEIRIQALDLARQLITGRDSPTPTREILTHVETLGVTIPGAAPCSNLSAMLSRSPDFRANGRAGWTLEVMGDG